MTKSEIIAHVDELRAAIEAWNGELPCEDPRLARVLGDEQAVATALRRARLGTP